jgi:Pyruvate:ferredoxin oxidoreductase and related 2-oxoacid:ferredoxin oxidoreductases, alpha subunit
VKCGVARVRVFRPFPEEKIKEVAASAENVVILDRDNSFGKGGVLNTEVRSILEGKRISNFIIGLGGTDVPYTTIEKCVEMANGQKDEWIMKVKL